MKPEQAAQEAMTAVDNLVYTFATYPTRAQKLGDDIDYMIHELEKCRDHIKGHKVYNIQAQLVKG